MKLEVKEPYLSFILNGQKTIEGRLNKGKFKDLVVGDILAFALTDRLFIVRQIDFYNSFREMIVSQGVKNVVPDKDTVEEAEAVYYKFYTKEQEREFGVLAIRIEAL